MSISLPTYTRREIPLLSRRHRMWAIIGTGLRRELRRPAAIVAVALGTLSTTVSSIVFVLFAPFLNPGQPLDLTFFYTPASNITILFFVTFMSAAVGAGLIADDLNTMALTLYLSRPLTPADYLTAKAAILGPLVALIAVLPLVITPLVAALLALFPWGIALEAMGLSILVGFLFTAFNTAVTLFLSSLTRRKAYAAAGVFAMTFGLTVPAEILASPGSLNNPNLLYLSPWEDFLALARAAFGVTGGGIDWLPALAILLSVTALAAFITYARMRAMEVVTG
jgi:ABC-type transport system involved in multi-copper enzyme maturation permease subunit